MKRKWPGHVVTERKAEFVTKLLWKGKPIILKVKLSSDSLTKNSVEREIAALDILKKLAAPKLVSISKKEVAKLIKQEEFCYLAYEWVPWRGCFARQFSPTQALGLWAFTLEQMCAFHRKGILYTDMKHAHLRVADDLSEARLVDFGGCLMVEPRGVYPSMALQFTTELCPPESPFQKRHTERLQVYQMGMLLGTFLLKYFHNPDIHPRSMRRLKAKLMKIHCGNVFELLKKCLSKEVNERPKDLETLFKLLQSQRLPSGSSKLWAKLRAPYENELSKLGLEGPATFTRTKAA